MITGGHVAISYLIAEDAKFLGVPLNGNQVLGIVLAGNLPDVDFLVGLVNGRRGELHHQNITHTPLGVFLIWLVILVLFKPDLAFSFILLASMVTHLFIDDLGNIAAKLGIYQQVASPQINWLYPFTSYSKHQLIRNNKEVLKHYLVKGWPIATIEVVLILVALAVYLARVF